MRNPWEDWSPCCSGWGLLVSYVTCKHSHRVSLTRIPTSWWCVWVSVEAPSELKVLSWRTEQSGPWEGGTERWGSLQSAVLPVSYLCFGLHDLLLSQSCWPGKQQCTLPNLSHCLLIQLWVVIVLFSALLVVVVQPSYCHHSSWGGGLKTHVWTWCVLKCWKLSFGFFRYCCESSLFCECLSIFASFGSQSLATVCAKKECCWFLFQRA